MEANLRFSFIMSSISMPKVPYQVAFMSILGSIGLVGYLQDWRVYVHVVS